MLYLFEYIIITYIKYFTLKEYIARKEKF